MFNVICKCCGEIFTPVERSPAWWIAKKRAERYLDAAYVNGKYCGCTPERPRASPFAIFGYDMEGNDFYIPCKTFVDAVNELRRSHGADVVFAEGLSSTVVNRINSK